MNESTNPWGLTKGQERVVDALTRTGSYKMVARELFRSAKTVECHMQAVKQKMKVDNQMMAAITYVLWKRGAK